MENVVLSIFNVAGVVLPVFAVIYITIAVVLCIQIYSFAISRCKKWKNLTLPVKQHRLFQRTDDWATENGFHYVGIFQVQVTFFATWENPEKSSFLLQFFNWQYPYFSIETIFDNNIHLETGNIRAGIILPIPLRLLYAAVSQEKS
jgi:hypothetical protein